MDNKMKNVGKVCVNLSRCGGHARCLEESPEVFGYDGKTNKAFVIEDADIDAHREAVERAILACPERAIDWSE